MIKSLSAPAVLSIQAYTSYSTARETNGLGPKAYLN